METPPNQPPASQTKPCPFCRVQVDAAAIRCPHCRGDIGRQELLTSKVCFVATATMGNDDHPDVVTLRVFRDVVLARYSAGRLFIRLYYRFGAVLAWPLHHSVRLRALSRKLIVKPLTALAKRFL